MFCRKCRQPIVTSFGYGFKKISCGCRGGSPDPCDDPQPWLQIIVDEHRDDRVQDDRVQREVIHMMTAVAWSKRSLCKQGEDAKNGAVITTGDLRRVLSVGYNGPARQLGHDYCRGTQGTCGCLHAEDNAISHLSSFAESKAIFITGAPCETCAERIMNAGISKVFYLRQYRDPTGLLLLQRPKSGVEVFDMSGRVRDVERLAASIAGFNKVQANLQRVHKLMKAWEPGDYRVLETRLLLQSILEGFSGVT